MKIYYKTLSKENKKELKKDFLKTNESKIYKKTQRLIFVCIVGIVFSIISIVFDILYKTGTINYVMDIILFIFCFIFFFFFNNIKQKEINKFALKKANK